MEQAWRGALRGARLLLFTTLVVAAEENQATNQPIGSAHHKEEHTLETVSGTQATNAILRKGSHTFAVSFVGFAAFLFCLCFYFRRKSSTKAAAFNVSSNIDPHRSPSSLSLTRWWTGGPKGALPA
jgi:hypothetical protein